MARAEHPYQKLGRKLGIGSGKKENIFDLIPRQERPLRTTFYTSEEGGRVGIVVPGNQYFPVQTDAALLRAFDQTQPEIVAVDPFRVSLKETGVVISHAEKKGIPVDLNCFSTREAAFLVANTSDSTPQAVFQALLFIEARQYPRPEHLEEFATVLGRQLEMSEMQIVASVSNLMNRLRAIHNEERRIELEDINVKVERANFDLSVPKVNKLLEKGVSVLVVTDLGNAAAFLPEDESEDNNVPDSGIIPASLISAMIGDYPRLSGNEVQVRKIINACKNRLSYLEKDPNRNAIEIARIIAFLNSL